MAEYSWPKQGTASLLGTEQDRVDGMVKANGSAKYAYDINPPNMLMAAMLASPHAHCKIKSIDASAARKVPGVVAVENMKRPGDEIRWQGDHIACVAAETEGAAAEGVAALRVEYEILDVFVDDADLQAAEAAGYAGKGGQDVQLVNKAGDNDDEDEHNEKELARLFKEAHVVIEGRYGIPAITHMCMEPHGSTAEWNDGKLISHLSTQNVSGTAGQLAQPLGITADDVTVHCDYIGGGFGSKFAADAWGVVAAKIAKDTGRPVKLMLTRDQELKSAGARPSGYIDVKVGADSKGVVTVWDSHHWGTSGPTGGGVSQAVVPFVFNPKNRRRVQTAIRTHTGPARAWRAPNHPQGAALTQTAYDDIAAKLGIDSYDVFLRNLPSVGNGKADVYQAEMEIGAKLIDWKAKWHPHGKGPVNGSIASGLGMSILTWGGGAGNSTCQLRIHPDGGVETFLGSQDLGTGTRTVIKIVLAETLGLPLSAPIKVNIGSSQYPVSGGSGGSTTVGGVSESNRRAAQDALARIFELVAAKLGVPADSLEAKNGRIQVANSPDTGLSWKKACGLLGMKVLETKGDYARSTPTTLSSSGVGGVQMAEVAVDKETGVIKVKKFVAVQDMGLIVNRKTAASQVYGGVIGGIGYALMEERIMDRKTGAFLNCQIDSYKLPRINDFGEIIIELYEPPSEYQRGIVGLGEPPVISPGCAISNAVANALGVRVPVLPLTPQRVLEAINKGGKA